MSKKTEPKKKKPTKKELQDEFKELESKRDAKQEKDIADKNAQSDGVG